MKITKINVIAQHSEKCITSGFNHMISKYCFSLLSSSLDKFVQNNKYIEIEKDKLDLLGNWETNFKFSNTSHYVNTVEDLDPITEKGVCPYDDMDSLDKFNDTQLPPKYAFYNELNGSHIKNEDYEKAHRVWDHLKISNMGEYHDIYLQTNMFLLTDVFENFRTMYIDYYGLDPAHYYTLPNFAWDAILKNNRGSFRTHYRP